MYVIGIQHRYGPNLQKMKMLLKNLNAIGIRRVAVSLPLNTATPRLANGLRTWWRWWWQRQRQWQYSYIEQDTFKLTLYCISALYYFVSSLSTNSVADFCWLSTSQLYCLTIENILLEYWALSTCICPNWTISQTLKMSIQSVDICICLDW